MKVFVAIISFILVFVAVTFIASIAMALLARPADGDINILTDWQGWVAIVLGLFAAVQSARKSLK